MAIMMNVDNESLVYNMNDIKIEFKISVIKKNKLLRLDIIFTLYICFSIRMHHIKFERVLLVLFYYL